ncbi:MAG: hypothetical protein ACK5VE_03595 [Alphaproteobacteria bacterium]
MRASVFNNPMLGAGLSELVRAYVGDPEKELRQQNMILDNEMAQLKLDQARSMGLGGMVARSMGGGSGGGGGGGGSVSTGDGAIPDLPERKLTESEKTRTARYVRDAGYEGVDAAAIQAAILDAFMNDPGLASLDEATSKILPGVTRTQDVLDPNEFINTTRPWSDFLGSEGSWDFDGLGDMFRGPVMGPERLVIPSITPAPVVGQPQVAPPQVGQPQGGIPQVSTEAEIAGLPIGSVFMTPDGKIRVKE